MERRNIYPQELRDRAVRLVFEARAADPVGRGYGAPTRIAAQLGLNPDTVRQWVYRAEEQDSGVAGSGTDSGDRARIQALERENRELRKTNEILRTASAFFAAAELDRCTVARLMRFAGLEGVKRRRTPKTTRPGSAPGSRPDLVERQFTSTTPNQLWVADITYIRTFTGWAYAAFVMDVFSRRILGWQIASHLRTSLALDALNMAIFTRGCQGQSLAGLIHHSDRGVQYGAIRYTERLAASEVIASVGSKGDSYDNSMAEAFNSIFKAELIRNKGPFARISDLEIAVAEYIDWYNNVRLHGEITDQPPVEYELNYYQENTIKHGTLALH